MDTTSRYGSRKFLIAVGALFVSAFLVWDKDIDAATFKTVVLGTVAAYITGNVAQRATAKPDATTTTSTSQTTSITGGAASS